MVIEKGTFIELDYTGRLEDGTVFDTTKESVAKEAGLNPKATYKPTIICVGEGHLLKGLDEFLVGKEPGTYTVELEPEQAFGKKDAKLLKLVPLKKFTENKIKPFVGLEVNIDGSYGVVRSLSGGRVTVDFNHPLASRNLKYDLHVHRVVHSTQEQVAAILDVIGLHHHGVSVDGDTAVVKVHAELPEPVIDRLTKVVARLTKAKRLRCEIDRDGHAKKH
ncbi:peptidylprolyl isomerase [Candidatus Woesearchaeota archaeon]|nr:MAG: peptidylprolyl isomerase [Candidatus Woesearchaeota archaeon]